MYDYKEELKHMVSVSTPWSFKKGEHIAQLLLLPYIGISKSSNVRHGGFGRTNKQINYSTLMQEQS
jgi:dUTPase